MKWTCKDGRVLDIKDMETSHLCNALNMLRRKGYCTPDEYLDASAYAFSPMTGEMAAMAVENELMHMKPTSAISKMERELAAREQSSVKP